MYKVIPKFQSFDKWMEIPFKMKNLENDYNFFIIIIIRMSLEGYYYCGWCEFKTKSERENNLHLDSPEHNAHFKHTYCEPCKKQCWNKPALEAHCETSKHKISANVRMNCESCNYTTNNQLLMTRHEQSQRHKNAVNGVVKEYIICEKCDYKTKHRSQFKIHEETEKHQNNINGVVKPNEYVCEACNYKTHIKSSMNLHEKSKKHLVKTDKNVLI